MQEPTAKLARATIYEDAVLSHFAVVPEPALLTARTFHTSMVIGQGLYVVGGNNNPPLRSVERAIIHTDGTLGNFANARVALMTPRFGHSMVRSGNNVYVAGGKYCRSVPNEPTQCQYLNSVERAPIFNGSVLGPFSTLRDSSLVTPRANHTSVVIGKFLYVIGGKTLRESNSTAESLGTVERALINGDGTLDRFTTVSGVNLVTRRGGHTSALIDNCLFVMGGLRIGGGEDFSYLTGVEKSDASTGELGAFAVVPGVTLALPREGHSNNVVLGIGKAATQRYLYEFGGVSFASPGPSVERATIP